MVTKGRASAILVCYSVILSISHIQYAIKLLCDFSYFKKLSYQRTQSMITNQ